MAAPVAALAPIRTNKAVPTAARGAAPISEETPERIHAAPGTQYARSVLMPNAGSIPVDPPNQGRSSWHFASGMNPIFLQCKLAVGSSNDPLETEADQAAAQVMGAHTPSSSQRGQGIPVLRRATSGSASPAAASAPPIVHRVLRSPGQPLDRQARAFMEPRFGRDFSHIRVHTDAAAAESAHSVGALAYAAGHHIAFNAGAFNPSTDAGRNLLAHELAHTVQQAGATSLESATLRRRRIPDSSSVDALVQPGATDQVAHKAGLLRLIRDAWNEMDDPTRQSVSVALISHITISLESHPGFLQSNDDWNLQWVVVRLSGAGAGAATAELARGVGNPFVRLTHAAPAVAIAPTTVGGPAGHFERISFEIATGSDDLRGNSVATARLQTGTGAVLQEIPLKRQADSSWKDNSTHNVSVSLSNALSLDQIVASLDAGSIPQLEAFARAIQAAVPDDVLGDPHLIDSGPRPEAHNVADQANINTLADRAQDVFDAIIAGHRDSDLRQIFGAAHVAAAKNKCRLAKAEMRRLQHIGKILTDWSGYAEETGVGGLTFFHRQIALQHGFLDAPTEPDSIATMVHESMHAGNADVTDNGYILTPPFLTLDWPLKLNNAAHFEVIAYRMLDPSNEQAYPDTHHPGHFLEFVPAGSGGTPPLTAREDAIGRANRKYEAAWDTAIDLHGILVRVYEHPGEWNGLDLHTSPDFGVAAGSRFSQSLPYWSKVLRMTIHARTGYPPPIPFPAPAAPAHAAPPPVPAGTPSASPVTQIDIAQSEHVTRKLGDGMEQTGTKKMTVAKAIDRESTATAAQTAQIAAGPAQEADVLVSLVRTQTIGEITGPPDRDSRVIDRLAQAHTGTYVDILAPKAPATFPN